jgi:DNA repair protein RadC
MDKLFISFKFLKDRKEKRLYLSSIMKLHDIDKESRPRERLLTFGIDSLSDAELLAIIFGMGTRGENVIDMSNRLISEFGLVGLFDSSLKELQKIKGIGQAKAMQILAIHEIGKRRNISMKKKRKITKAGDVFDLFYDKLKDEQKETFSIILMDVKNNIISCEEISTGILDASIVHPREIFKPAIKNSAARIILVHNHPSGDSSPSEEDIDITKKIIDAGEIIGIEVLDHVIIGEDYWSYVEGEVSR